MADLARVRTTDREAFARSERRQSDVSGLTRGGSALGGRAPLAAGAFCIALR